MKDQEDQQTPLLEEEEPQTKVEKQLYTYKGLATLCVIGGILSGVFKYTYGLYSYLGTGAVMLSCYAYIASSVLFYIYRFIQYERETQHHEFNKRRFWLNIAFVVVRVILTFLCYFFVMKAYIYCGLANINTGISTAIMCCSSVFTTIYCYFALGEKLTHKMVLGITLLLTSAGLVAISEDSSSEGDSEASYMFLMVLYSFLSAFFLSAATIICKYAFVLKISDPIDYTFNTNFLFGLLLLPFALQYSYTTKEFLLGFFGNSMEIIATVLLIIGITRGLAGPLGCLKHIDIVSQTLLGMIFSQLIPNAIQMVAIIIVLIGTLLVMYGKEKKAH